MIIRANNIQTFFSKLTLSVMIFALAVVQPANIVLAAEENAVETTTSPDVTTTSAPVAPVPPVEPAPVVPVTGPQTPPGPTQPNGVDAHTYIQNIDTGNWENDQYIWDPTTHQTRPKKKPDYYYDPASGTWSTNEWTYDAAQGKYIVTPKPVAPSLLAQLGLLAGGGRANIDGTGPNSNNQINSHDSANGIFNLYTQAEINNYFGIYSLSGDSSVVGNTTGGDASTGDASVLANILNLLASAWNISGGQMLTFFESLYGDVNGDILLDTGDANSSNSAKNSGLQNSIANTGPNSNNTIGDTKDGSVAINSAEYNDINNNVVIASRSGDAVVGCAKQKGTNVETESNGIESRSVNECSGNTTAGSAKSGNAKVMLNLLNLINSYISSGKSFFGVINIYGNLNGDILFSKDFINQLLASGAMQNNSSNSSTITNTGPNSNNAIDSNRSGSLTSNTNDLSTINNNIVTNAKSGDANVSGNTAAGDAHSGKADIKLTLLNLTGHQVVAKNAVLVFVNVFGSWLGLIMDAPAGTKSALLGGGVTQNNQAQPGNSTNNTNAVNNINNNLDLSAISGDADVIGNTKAGDATSGDADIAINVGNIINSDFSMSDWFGVLFINVFGNWVGSLGVDTAAGNTGATQTAQSIQDNNVNQSTEFQKSQWSSAFASSPYGNNVLASSVTTVEKSVTPNNAQLAIAGPIDYKRPASRPFSDYAFPLFAIIAISVAGVLFQLSKKYSRS